MTNTNGAELRHLPELPGYGITEDGRILSPNGKWLACSVSGNGYRLFSAGRPQKFWPVHRVVALAYLGSPPSPKHEVAHLNGIRTDNRVQNLAWKTRAENQADRILHGTSNRGAQHPLAKLNAEQVLEIRRRYQAGGILQRELAAEFNVTREAVSAAVRGVTWFHTGSSEDLAPKGNHPSSRKTHCPRGHAYSAENTYYDSRGYRNCRTCRSTKKGGGRN